MLKELLTPGGDQLGVRVEIRNLGRDGEACRAQQSRQAQQVCVHVHTRRAGADVDELHSGRRRRQRQDPAGAVRDTRKRTLPPRSLTSGAKRMNWSVSPRILCSARSRIVFDAQETAIPEGYG